LLSLYFTYSGVAAAYGSAGALVVILLWIYYSSQLFFYGVEVTRVVVTRREHDQSIEVGEPSTGSTIESPTE
ncbi:MAG: YihY/virulence factor BrkB family protein, partial [Fimbriimonadaceae bacterium]|nr:YihY/virulence factor BrkB family protein [Fimbriimonadaceae bacterium]